MPKVGYDIKSIFRNAMSDFRKNDAEVRKRFWEKIRSVAPKIPFLVDAIALYYCATDKDTPVKAKAIALAALVYFITPTDFIPDFFAGIGFTDDAAAIMFAVRTLRKELKDCHRQKARDLIRGKKYIDIEASIS